MSIEALNWAKKICVSPTQKLLLLVLADCANGDGISFPSTAYLEKITCLSRRAIFTAKKELLEKGIIKKEPWMRIFDLKLCLEKDFSEKMPFMPKSASPALYSASPALKSAAPALFSDSENDGIKSAPPALKSASGALESASPAPVPEPPITINNHLNSTPYNPPQEILPSKPKPKTEKQKSEKSKFELPNWIPLEAWNGWLEMRTKKKTPNTPRAKNRAIKKLAKFFELGYDIGEILDNSTYRGWTDVYEPKQKSDVSFSKPHVFKTKKPKYNPFDEFVENEYQPDDKIITDVEYQELIQKNLIEG